MNKTFERRFKAGLCIWCKGTPVQGKQLCLECLKIQANRNKQRAAKLKESGLCVQCKNTAAEGKTLCKNCAASGGILCKQRSEKLKNNGLCVRCSKKCAEGKVLCQTCAEEVNIFRESRIKNLSLSKICITCGINPAEDDKNKCGDCWAKQKEQMANRNKVRVQVGLCTRCPNPSPPGKTMCKECQEKRNTYERERRAVDPVFKVTQALRKRMKQAIKKGCKVGSAVEDLGCSVKQLWVYLEAAFKPGMTVENYGEVWDIDHIRPIASFNLSDRAQLLEAVHFSNLQPLFKTENKSKGSLHEGKRHFLPN